MAFYPFSNGTLNDLSGNSNHLNNPTQAFPVADRRGNQSCAFEFNNSAAKDQFLTRSNPIFLNGLSEFSVSLWYEPRAPRNGSFETLISRDLNVSCPDRNGQWSVSLYDCRKAVFGRTNSVWDKDVVSNPDFTCEAEISARTNSWHHIVATYKQAGTEMAIYRDGVLQESSLGDANCGSGIPSVQDIGDLFLGKDYTGRIDDVIIFKKALDHQGVNMLYNMDACCVKD